MKWRRLTPLLAALMTIGYVWRPSFRLPGQPARYTGLRVGDYIDVPAPFGGRCLHVVVVHGTCQGCEDIRGRDDALWLAPEDHPRNSLFPRLFVSPPLWDALQVRAIPLEYVIESSGRVRAAQNPVRHPPLSCDTRESGAR